MPILWALANPKLDEREAFTAIRPRAERGRAGRPGLLLIADKGFAFREFEADLAVRGAQLLRPSFKREKHRTSDSLLNDLHRLDRQPHQAHNGRDDTHLARDLLGDKGQSAYVKRPLKPYRAAEAGSLV
ncbi:hypothetical protein AB0K74_46245 [Streptomyces sp. NPDC056159]|uniref:hypothetical protein n=1 Tax=unclassified Streptomyces TaxID=2593676 RepID=UPI003415202B